MRPLIVERARKFNHIDTALDYGLRWARYFGGGDDAWRAIALALKRSDRVYEKRTKHVERPTEDLVRHDLDDHGTVTRAEADAINRHLVALGVYRLIQAQREGMWWHSSPLDVVRGAVRMHLERLAKAELAFEDCMSVVRTR